MRGGYQIIDLRNAALTSGEAVKIPGAYAVASNPYGKPTLISGLIVGGVEYPEIYVPFVSNDNTMNATIVVGGTTIIFSIASTDDVTVTVQA